MSSFPNDPFLIYKRKGDKTDPFLQYYEPKTVSNGKVILTELPDKGNHVNVDDGTNTYAEITSQASLSASNVYYVDYDRGIVYFDSSKEGLKLNFKYLGIGGSYVPATRVYTQSANGTVTQDVQDMIDNYNQLNGTDLYRLFDPQTGHKHTGASGDAPPIDSQHVNYSGNGVSSTSNVKDTLDSHASQLADIMYDAKIQGGAVGDGVHDDTNAINNALTYCKNNNITRLKIPKGTYLINGDDPSGNYNYYNGGITVNFPITIEMDKETIIQIKTSSLDGYTAFNIKNTNNVTIIGGQIIGDLDTHNGSTGEYGFGLYFGNVQNICVENVTVSKCWGDGIMFDVVSTYYNQNNIIKNCTLDTNRRNGLTLSMSQNVHVLNCLIKNTGTVKGTAPMSGIDIESSGANEYGVFVEGNTFDNNKTADINVSSNMTGLHIVNNHLNNVSQQGVILSNGCNSINNVVIEGNSIIGSTGSTALYGVSIQATGGNGVNVKGNVIKNINLATSGVGVEYANGATNVSISQNIIDGCYMGMEVYPSVGGSIISSNNINNVTYGINFDSSAVENVTVSNNRIENCSSVGLKLRAYHSTVVGNTIRGTTSHGIWLELVTDSVIQGNNIIDFAKNGTDAGLFNYNSSTGRNLISNNVFSPITGTPLSIHITNTPTGKPNIVTTNVTPANGISVDANCTNTGNFAA